MLSQQKSDIELLTLFRKIFALVILLLVLSYLAFSHFDSIKQVGQQSIKTEHNRLLNILGIIRSQWLIKGRPEQLKLDWRSHLDGEIESISYVSMAVGGWPLPDETSVAGCRDLIEELLGESYTQQIVTKFNSNTGVCRYIGVSGGSISYQTTSGRVIFLTGGR
ncbi:MULTISPECIES: hypothetical protein [unclassified Shewanella]|uniref:hypothetical protein n=1 Tax=unclassified Shewanella TaxID=196818 RepID=UPI001E2C297C|nr:MULTISPECIES: hypothetical protein [unclassified Shewanella]